MTGYTDTLYYDWLYRHTVLCLAIQAHCIMTGYTDTCIMIGYTGTLYYDWLYRHLYYDWLYRHTVL